MPANHNELLMSLSADVMLKIIDSPHMDPSLLDIPDLAFQHAQRLINLNLNFQRQAQQHVEQKAKPKH